MNIHNAIRHIEAALETEMITHINIVKSPRGYVVQAMDATAIADDAEAQSLEDALLELGEVYKEYLRE